MEKSLKLFPWLAAAAMAWSLGLAYNIYYGGLISWLQKMYHNKIALVDQVEGPRRLLIVGGSGAHYSINSELLEQKLGFPVFNLGLDGNLGLNVIFPSIIEHIRPNDVVLVIPEYLMLMDEDGIGERSTAFGVATGRPMVGGVPLQQFLQDLFILGTPSLRNLTKSGINVAQRVAIPEYYADPLTPWGDPTKTWIRKSRWYLEKIEQPMSDHSAERIRQFKEEVEAKGATLILSLPVVLGSDDPETLENVEEAAQKLGEIAPLVYDPQSLNIHHDPALFADTHYHLRPEGRAIRAKELGTQLQPLLHP